MKYAMMAMATANKVNSSLGEIDDEASRAFDVSVLGDMVNA